MLYYAFLRAINVGGHTVKMDRLRGLFEELGFDAVRSFIASGNLVFETDDVDATSLERRIEGHLEEGLGWPAATFLRGDERLQTVATHEPFDAAQGDGDRLYIAFLRTAPDRAAADAIEARTTADDLLAVRDREVYWLCRIPFQDTTVPRDLERILGTDMTLRNVNTVRRMARKYGAGST